MDEPQPFKIPDRRHPHVSHEELRRQLLAADEERYRLRLEVHAPRSSRWARLSPPYRRAAVGLGTVIMTALVGGLAWQMCPSSARASEQRPVRVVTTTVTPHLVVAEPPRAQLVKVKGPARSPRRFGGASPSARDLHAGRGEPVKARAPRPGHVEGVA